MQFKVLTGDISFKDVPSCRESQEFVEKYEGALGKGKGRKLYAYKVMMTKVGSDVYFCIELSQNNTKNVRLIFHFMSLEVDEVPTRL